MQSNDPFLGEGSSYDPERAFFLAHDTHPPYGRTNLRLSIPTSLNQAMNRFMREDPEKVFVTTQQILRNAFYHGFYHMRDIQGFTRADEIARVNADDLALEEKLEFLRRKTNQLVKMKEMLTEAKTSGDKADVIAIIRNMADREPDLEHAGYLRQLTQPW